MMPIRPDDDDVNADWKSALRVADSRSFDDFVNRLPDWNEMSPERRVGLVAWYMETFEQFFDPLVKSEVQQWLEDQGG